MPSISSLSQRINNLTQSYTIAVLFLLIFLILELLLFLESSCLFIFTRLTYINFCLTILIALRNNNCWNIYSSTIEISSGLRIPFLMTQFINTILNWVLIFLNIFGKTFSRKDSCKQWIYVSTAFFCSFAHLAGHKVFIRLVDEIGEIYESMKIFYYMTYVMNFIAYFLIYQLCDTDDPIQLALIFCTLSRCLEVLNFMLLTHVSRIIFGSLLVLDAITKLSDVTDLLLS